MPDSDHEDAPRWFKNYLTEFHALQSSVNELQTSINHRMDNFESRLAIQEDRMAEMNAEINTLRAESSCSAQPAAPSPTPAHEAFEILVTGIPHSFASNNTDFVRKLLSFLNLAHLLNFVVDMRPWRERQHQSDEAAENSTRSRGVVLGCSSTYVRDKITAAAGKLRDANCSAIFGDGGESSIYLRALWPKPVYEL